ncbi:phosphatase PAP2 family protein [Scopulibacillus darangshiensis]|uniref:phosphatase PAP2 family protein n=1 Tax=Scopulibacillus darangshiensis TaxID=442528 RepID=UPI001050F57F|nr:phosphatase PAP2 family protein [Scopulibacillus darangshiensis]
MSFQPIKMKKQLGIIILLLVLFGVIRWLTVQPWFLLVDIALLKGLEPLREPGVVHFFIWMTELGSSNWLIIFVAIGMAMLIYLHRPIGAVLFVINFLGARLLNLLLKLAFVRMRPDLHHFIDVSGYSFPSGHAMNAISVYGCTIYILNKLIKRKVLSYLITVVFVLLIVLIALSRPMLDVHYFTDIAGGLSGGGIWLTFTILLMDRYVFRRRRRTDTRD